jgi:hypothetical protein
VIGITRIAHKYEFLDGIIKKPPMAMEVSIKLNPICE